MLPAKFIENINAQLPQHISTILLDALTDKPTPTSIRINKNKINNKKIIVPHTQSQFSNEVFYLVNRPSFVADPAFHAGVYYVQEASSSVVGEIVEQILPNANCFILDLCAAPGGKSTHLSSVIKDTDVLICNEIIHSRVGILYENLCKWGNGNAWITNATAAQHGNANIAYDIVVADMPCSGEGMFRKEPEACNFWNEKNVQLCVERQQKIAAEIWPALKQNGYFIYSTCTFNTKENEENIQWICKNLGAEIVELNTQNMNLIQLENGCYRCIPGVFEGEGLFFCVLKKNNINNKKNNMDKLKFIKQSPNYLLGKENNSFMFNNEIAASFLDIKHNTFLLNNLPKIYAPPIVIGKEIRGEIIPNAALALNMYVSDSAFQGFELNDENAIQYLQKQTIVKNEKTSGYFLAKWQNINLGFLKAIDKHYNNLWPTEWRIRKELKAVNSIFFEQ